MDAVAVTTAAAKDGGAAARPPSRAPSCLSPVRSRTRASVALVIPSFVPSAPPPSVLSSPAAAAAPTIRNLGRVVLASKSYQHAHES